MSRKQKFSNNWKKAKGKVQKIHPLIANARRDYLHKATTMISQNHAIVCIEDLQVRNLSKSAAGSREKPGRNVRAKSGLNRSILRQGWRGGRCRDRLWRAGAVRPLGEAGTHRSDSGGFRVSAVGIPRLQAGEDVKAAFLAGLALCVFPSAAPAGGPVPVHPGAAH